MSDLKLDEDVKLPELEGLSIGTSYSDCLAAIRIRERQLLAALRESAAVLFWDAYKPGSPETVIREPYLGYEVQTIQHDFFGPDPVEVFAIRTGRPSMRKEKQDGNK